MKIGIITFTYGQNYGNKLQNYALLSVLKNKYGDNVYTLQNFDETTKRSLKDNLKNKIKTIVKFKKEQYYKKRRINFDMFNKKYLNYYRIPLISKNFNQFDDFDSFICGSDQIWNPYYNKNMDLFTAAFSNKGKRISYAASMGLSNLPEELISKYKKSVGGMDYIGVREQEGAELLKKILGRDDISVQVDPTMLLTSNEWNLFAKKPNKKIPNEYILTYFIKNMGEEAKNSIYNYAKENNLKVISLNDSNNINWFDISPNEFVWLIKNAKFVFSDSFHATVFSIIFHKQFHCFERKNKEETNKQESRLYTLLGYFELQDKIGDFNNKQENINWDSIDNTMDKLKQDSLAYLFNAIGNCNKEVFSVYDRKELCCGCGLCAQKCPVNAITMRQDDEGYRYPVIDKNKCINCGKCKEICIYRNPIIENKDSISSYEIQNKNDEIRNISSSGGVFFGLAEKMMNENGNVVSPKFNNNFELNHEIIKSVENIKEYCGSKYTQSKSDFLFADLKNKLDNGERVLFTGTPCQIQALKKYLGSEYYNLVTQDIICHGCSSEKVLKQYIKFLEGKFKSKVVKVNFRNKELGWKDFGIKVTFENNSTLLETHSKNEYFKLFLTNYALRPSCYDCIFRKISNVSDITLGDFWGIKESDNKGTSLVLINSEKGKNIVESIETIKSKQVDFQESIKNNPAYTDPLSIPNSRNWVINSPQIEKIFSKYKIAVIKEKIFRKLNKIL